jgi:hypothetical protein
MIEDFSNKKTKKKNIIFNLPENLKAKLEDDNTQQTCSFPNLSLNANVNPKMKKKDADLTIEEALRIIMGA